MNDRMNLWENLKLQIKAFRKKIRKEEEPLCEAITQRAVDTVESLLIAGADANAIARNGMTMLMYAAMDSVELTRLLLDHGANVNATVRDGTTALHYTQNSKYGNPEVIKELLKRGADVNAATNDGYTALMGAISSPRRRDAACALIEGGADVHRQWNGLTILEMALIHSRGEENEITAMLRRAGAQ